MGSYKHVTCFGVLFQCFSNLFLRWDKSSFVGSILGGVGVHFKCELMIRM
jgi:hypothetical protein